MREKRKYIMYAIVSLSLFVGLVLSPSRNRAVFFEPEGYIIHGGKFGVKIGDKLIDGIEHLEGMSLTRYTELRGGAVGFEIFNSSSKITVMSDNSWRKGAISLISENGKIVAIDWYFNPFTP